MFFIIYVDNNEDDIQSTEETMLIPDNYEEEDKTQDATKKPESNIMQLKLRNI